MLPNRSTPIRPILLLAALLLAGLQARAGAIQGVNLDDCVAKLQGPQGGWCEIRNPGDKPSIAAVWPPHLPPGVRMETGPQSVLLTWNSAALDPKRRLMYFTGGGHRDYGGNEVYRFDLNKGQWRRLTDPSILDRLFIANDVDARADKPWRRLCWMPDTLIVPASAHTYDGLLFSKRTDTLFLYVMRAANGSCFEDTEDSYHDTPLVYGPRLEASLGWYEFNPSETETRNGLEPLTWRKVFGYQALRRAGIHAGFPVSAQLDDGRIVFGSRKRTAIYDPARPLPDSLRPFSHQADWGVGTMLYDPGRKLIWSIHRRVLLAFDARTGKKVRSIDAEIDHGKSLALDRDGHLVSWNGEARVHWLDPDEPSPKWHTLDWSDKGGPRAGDQRVYGKWVYLKDLDVFAGIATDKTGFWIYRQPRHGGP